MHRPILGLLLGFAITGIVQSSSASMGMLIALATQGLIPLSSALPILYGDNIGTCVTSLLSSIGASRNAKRAAIMHLLFNVIGSILFLLILNRPITYIVTQIDPTDAARQIANAHTLFNLINVAILLPFSKYIVKLAIKLVPDNNDENDDKATKYLDERMLETPSIALGNTIKEILRMGNIAKKCLSSSMDGFINKSEKSAKIAFETEETINILQKSILNYLLNLSKTSLPDNLVESVDVLFNTVNDIERIGDHSENIAELATTAIENDLDLSSEGIAEVNEMYKMVIQNYEGALKLINEKNHVLAKQILEREEEVNRIEKSIRINHIYRLNNEKCSIDSGILYIDLISNLERVSDHCANIAKRSMN